MRRLAVPAHHGGRDLVAERDHRYRRVVGERADAVDHRAPDLAQRAGVVEKRDVLRPRQPDHHPQAGAGRLVEDRPAGHGVDPHGVDAEGAHPGEVVGHLTRGPGTAPPSHRGRTSRRRPLSGRTSRRRRRGTSRHVGCGVASWRWRVAVVGWGERRDGGPDPLPGQFRGRRAGSICAKRANAAGPRNGLRLTDSSTYSVTDEMDCVTSSFAQTRGPEGGQISGPAQTSYRALRVATGRGSFADDTVLPAPRRSARRCAAGEPVPRPATPARAQSAAPRGAPGAWTRAAGAPRRPPC